MSDSLTLQPVAVIHTPYKEKFSIPRQPNLVQDGTGIVELLPPYNQAEAVRGLVELRHVECKNGKVLLHLGAVDLVDGTPILDIKPYLAYADSEPDAISGFAQSEPKPLLQVEFTLEAESAVKKHSKNRPHLQHFITEVIQQDPRPAYQQGKATDRLYGISLYDLNVKWRIKVDTVDVAEIVQIETLVNHQED